jgi:hypothetical protein
MSPTPIDQLADGVHEPFRMFDLDVFEFRLEQIGLCARLAHSPDALLPFRRRLSPCARPCFGHMSLDEVGFGLFEIGRL